MGSGFMNLQGQVSHTVHNGVLENRRSPYNYLNHLKHYKILGLDPAFYFIDSFLFTVYIELIKPHLYVCIAELSH